MLSKLEEQSRKQRNEKEFLSGLEAIINEYKE